MAQLLGATPAYNTCGRDAHMKISQESLGLFLVLASCTVVAQSPEEKPGSAIEIVAVRATVST